MSADTAVTLRADPVVTLRADPVVTLRADPVVTLRVNGRLHELTVGPQVPLLQVLRNDLQLNGPKFGCGLGECGACTVLVDGVPVRSCLTACGTVGRQKITTIEGLERDGRLHPLQQALLDVGAFQCAYCASGMVMSGVSLLAKNPRPTEAEIIRFMDGNVCRCGGYGRIIEAIQLAASRGPAPAAR